MKVKNIKGTSGKTCKCTSWYAHWKKYSKRNKLRCSNVKCNNKREVGAHVRKYNSTDQKHYIVPLCKTCNNTDNTKIIDIGETELVWSTCQI